MQRYLLCIDIAVIKIYAKLATNFQSDVKIIFLILPGELLVKKIDEPMTHGSWYVRHDLGSRLGSR